jgi:NAD(P)-dependent dehydrogenase (short-subunit alcohol dehydrogenase family)
MEEHSMKDFNNKVVVITGGATGIGFSFAKRFGEAGAKLVIAGRRQEKLDEACATLAEQGIEASGFACDIGDYAQVEALADFAEATYGGADVIMNNAGILIPPSSVIDADRDQVQSVMDVNYMGVWNGSSIFGKRFVARGTPAAIYNVGSENAFFNIVPGMFAYESAKHGLHSMTDALREETPDFIDVSFVCPGFVQSEMTAMAGDAPMDTEQYTGIAWPQILAGEYYVVSHPYNVVWIKHRYDEMMAAYEKYAPRYEGDWQYDPRTMQAKAAAAAKADGQKD